MLAFELFQIIWNKKINAVTLKHEEKNLGKFIKHELKK